MFPLYQSIPFFDPFDYFQTIADHPFAMFLDSSRQHANFGRYSYIVCDPFLKIRAKNGIIKINDDEQNFDLFVILNKILKQYPLSSILNCPPFQGGLVGCFSYDLAHHIEILPKANIDDMAYDDLALGCYDVVLSFDLIEKKAWIFSSGYPELEPARRLERAQSRLLSVLELFAKCQAKNFTPSQAVISCNQIQSPFSKETYCQAVKQFIKYILEGDIFEGTMSQRFLAPLPDMTAFELYERLRRFNSAPFSAYLNLGDQIIASASPERFLKLEKDQVEARPIKGTARRSLDPIEDSQLAEWLKVSQKDRAENVMIVDLMRNDLSRVCENNSVKVPQLCALESYETVHHLVSVVIGKLKQEYNAIDLLKATFPGGSVTGAPKIRAMEIIAELEPTARGPYCGSVGYIGFNGNMDLSIIIRTFLIKNNKVTFQVGSAIVADSELEAEYDESLIKAAAMIKALVEY